MIGNRFTGSDINYATNFEKHFGYTQRIALDKIFKVNDKINAFATNFITQNPSWIKNVSGISGDLEKPDPKYFKGDSKNETNEFFKTKEARPRHPL